MPTKTDRILSYLPSTFKTSPRPAVLYPVADAFGNELLLGENCLAAIMLAHWVDFADKNELKINDLEKMASLYGLAPWLDESGESIESVEEFREHLKRYVRTFIEGTVTVQGILRVAAEALALRIDADAPEQLDRWWTRKQDELSDVVALGNDAAAQLNFDHPSASGSSALPAHVTGTVDLSEGISLLGANILRLKVDSSFEEVDLADGSDPAGLFDANKIVEVINRSPRPTVASYDGRFLKLASPTTGPTSKLEVVNGINDAAPRLMGLLPKSYHGAAATAAQFKGTVDLSTPIDLSHERYLRIEVDGKQKEIDCAGDDAAHTTLNQVRDAINNAFPGLNIADDDGKHLTLTSPTKGIGSSISVQPPASQNAALKIMGVPSFFAGGLDAQPARAESTRDLRDIIDLSERANIRLRIDGANPVTINCAGDEPDKTERADIVAAINNALNAVVATITERSISVASPTNGPASEIVFEEPAAGDATFDIFGIGPLSFQGSAPKVARLTGLPTLKDNGLDVRSNNFLVLAVDGSAAVEIDLSKAARNHAEMASLPLDRVAEHINRYFGGAAIASTDGQKLFLTSPRTGGVSKLDVRPRETVRKRRFVTRAIVRDEAAQDVFGFVKKEAQGTSPVRARLIGTPDLSLSVDLKETRFLRLRVDGSAPVEIDCAGDRPRATTLKEVVDKINAQFPTSGNTKIATDDGKHLALNSPILGKNSRLAIEPPHVALATLMDHPPGTFRGSAATAVKFSSTVDLTDGITLPANAKIKLAIDGAASAEILLGDATSVKRFPADIVNAINKKLVAPVAKTDGRRIELNSAKTGPDSKIKFEVPSDSDVTAEVFGINAPREYQGDPAGPARVVGRRDLRSTQDLRVFRFLSVSLDGQSRTFDCASKAAKPEAVTLAEIVDSIGAEVASASSDGRLILSSANTGPTAQLTLQPFSKGDAGKALLGNDSLKAPGKPALPAVITGEKSLFSSIDLSRRSLLRIAVDDGRPVDIDVAGAVPAKTALDEIVTRINQVFPNLAAANADDQLQLTSTTAGAVSKLSLQPLRLLEVEEYPLRAASAPAFAVKHHDSWTVENDGVAQTNAEIRITAPHGTVGPGLVNTGVGWSVHLFEVLERGETARLFRDPWLGFQAQVIALDGSTRSVPGSQILVGPIGAQAWVPFKEMWTVSDRRPLQLNNPQASRIVLLRAQKPENQVNVEVVESDIKSLPPATIKADGTTQRLAGRIQRYDKGFRLFDASNAAIAELLAGPGIDLWADVDKVVQVEGPIYSDTTPLMLVQSITELFDVVLSCTPEGSPLIKEAYPGVSIGAGTTDENSLVLMINAGSGKISASELLHGEELDKAVVLNLATGKTIFRYLDCLGSRFDDAYFDEAHFAGGCFNVNDIVQPLVPCCSERGIFDVSRFSDAPPEKVGAIFAADDPFPEPPVNIEFRWEKFSAGSFVVNLPADLPARFGARFDDARFGQDKESPEGGENDSPDNYKRAVAEPEDDPRFLVKLMSPESGNESNFVTATLVRTVELGWTPVAMPFRKPQFLTLGGRDRAARLYLSELGLNGFIRLDAKDVGPWGNEISVSARQAGPAIYDVSIIYHGGRFEQARSIVFGKPRETIQEFLAPGPTGVLQAKAAGVRADVTRERAEF